MSYSVWPEKNGKCLEKLPKMISLENDFDTFKKLPKNVEDVGKLIVAKAFNSFPIVQ